MAQTIYSNVYRVHGRPKKKATERFKPISTKHLPIVTSVRDGALDYKACASTNEVGVALISSKPRYEDEAMAQREHAAQQEIEYKKTCVAIPYNKGAYQYVTEGMDPKNFGRK